MLAAFVLATRDGIVDAVEAQFLRATRRVLVLALVLIVTSGIAITVMHFIAGQGATILTSAFLFKWLLIVTIVALSALTHLLPETFAEALLGANWYALFIVHILAPIATWTNLFILWGIWVAGFCLCWYAGVLLSRHSNGVPAEPKPLFTLFKKKAPAETAVEPEEPKAEPVVKKDMPRLLPVEELPKEMPKIVLDRTHVAPILQPAAIGTPVEIKIQPSATFQPPVSQEKAPAGKTTDTPFLPQVPPLQPIPITQPTTPAAIVPTNPLAPAASVVSLDPAAPSVPPEIKLGLTVMPKNPDQMPK